VVVLDEHGAVESQPVVPAAPATDRILFQQAPAGGGLARIEDARPCARHSIHISSSHSGNAAQSAQEVEQYPFRAKNGGSRPFDAPESLSGVETAPIVCLGPPLQARVEPLQSGLDGCQAGRHARLSGCKCGLCMRVLGALGQQGLRGQIARPTQIFGNGQLQQGQPLPDKRLVPRNLGEFGGHGFPFLV